VIHCDAFASVYERRSAAIAEDAAFERVAAVLGRGGRVAWNAFVFNYAVAELV
jgi:hypothetical protein